MLAAHLLRAEEQKAHPWRRDLAAATDFHARNDAEVAGPRARELLRERFRARPRAGLVRADEAFVLGLPLGDESILLIASLLLGVGDPQERIRLMNWRFLGRQDPTTLARHGPAMGSLGLPLFADETLTLLNEKILDVSVRVPCSKRTRRAVPPVLAVNRCFRSRSTPSGARSSTWSR